MLYLHCGWPRTGTTSLQTVLYERRDLLAEAGLVYPDRWLGEGKPAHHQLDRMLIASLEAEGDTLERNPWLPDIGILYPGFEEMWASSQHSGAARTVSPRRTNPFDDLKRFLEANADRDVLFSAEGLCERLLPDDVLNAFLQLLAAAQEIVPTRCVWTLRRLDRLLISAYGLMLERGRRDRIPGLSESEYVLAQIDPDALFAGMRAVDQAVCGEVAYARYDTSGSHNAALLEGFGLPPSTVDALLRELKRAPRHNQSNSADAGHRIDRHAIMDLHAEALGAARRHGIGRYVDFFQPESAPEAT